MRPALPQVDVATTTQGVRYAMSSAMSRSPVHRQARMSATDYQAASSDALDVNKMRLTDTVSPTRPMAA